MKYLFLLLIPISLMSCKNSEAQKIDQGITGQIRWYEGNMMPGPGNKAPEGEPVQREIHLYKLVAMNKAVREGVLYKEIPSKLVKKVETDENGNFAVSLPAGRYSLFTKEEEGLFASVSDGEGNVNPITVEKGKVTEVDIAINYKASY